MANPPSQSQLCRIYTHEAIHMLQTKESDPGIIFGTPLDLFNEKLAHNIKQTNIATAFDNVHCLDFWMGHHCPTGVGGGAGR